MGEPMTPLVDMLVDTTSETITEEDAAILAQAQRRIEERRAAYEAHQKAHQKAYGEGRHAHGHWFAPAPTRFTASGMITSELTDVSKRPFLVPPPREDCEPDAAEIAARTRKVIPEVFHGVTWTNIGELRREERRSLKVVENEKGQRLYGSRAVTELRSRLARAWKAGKNAVFLGETRAGKSLAASAALAEEIARGAPRPRWVHALTLKEPGAITRALTASILVIDDLGNELANAPENSGWIPGLVAPAVELINRWYLQKRGQRLLVTTYLDYGQMTAFYGAGTAARVYEFAEIIPFHCDIKAPA